LSKLVKDQYLVSSFFTFFLIHSSQIGAGILGFQTYISKDARQDAWIPLLIAGGTIHLIIWLLYRTLDEEHNDLVAIHHYCFGKIIGNLFSLLVMIFFLFETLTVYRTYIEIIQVWVYPYIKTWQLGIIFALVMYYFVSSGFRVLTGFSFWGVILPSILLITLYFPLQHAKPLYLFPMFEHSLKDLFLSFKASTYLFLGFEWILLYYPFIKDRERSSKYAHLGNLYSTILYLVAALVSFVYFNQEVLQEIPWATLQMVKIVMFPFIERFEYIFIFLWLLVIISPLCISIWACTRIVKRITPVHPKVILITLLCIVLVSASGIKDWDQVEMLGGITSSTGFYFIYLYLPLLFLIKQFKKRLG
jgi:spore germination protein (amino acid permease)